MRKQTAFLFDLDGTLIDSVYQHVLAWKSSLDQEGIPLSVWRIHRKIGMSGGLFAHILLRETGFDNTPERLAAALAEGRAKGLLPDYPFGSDLTQTEITLADALRHLKANTESVRGLMHLVRDALRSGGHPPANAEPFLERLGLLDATSMRDRTLRMVVVAALRETGAI